MVTRVKFVLHPVFKELHFQLVKQVRSGFPFPFGGLDELRHHYSGIEDRLNLKQPVVAGESVVVIGSDALDAVVECHKNGGKPLGCEILRADEILEHIDLVHCPACGLQVSPHVSHRIGSRDCPSRTGVGLKPV